jgi:hypothetical protein
MTAADASFGSMQGARRPDSGLHGSHLHSGLNYQYKDNIDIGPELSYFRIASLTESVRDLSAEGTPESGARAVPAGGAIHSAPGRSGHRPRRHHDRRARCLA